jgi:membrane dipeptidase
MTAATHPVADWQRLHADATVIDSHSDIPADVVRRRALGEDAGVFGRVHASVWRRGGLDAAVVTVGGDQLTEPTPLRYARAAIALLREDEEGGDALALVAGPDELRQAVADGRIAMILNCEGGRPLEGSLASLDELHRAGLRFLTLTWSSENELGHGVGTGPGGLTDFGASVVRDMAQLGMVADVSHAAEETFWDVLRLGTGNVVASHSNAAALCDHPRNLTDDQLRALADQGGYVGVCVLPDFLHGERPGLNEIGEHIEHIAELIGIEHVAIGFDFFDFLPAEEARARLSRVAGEHRPQLARYPNYAEGFEGVERTPQLTRVLAERGLGEHEIKGVLGENLLRAWARIQAAAG